MTSLHGSWSLRDDSGAYQLTATVPGDIVSALYQAERIPDPYWGRNEYDLRWIAERDWVMERAFTLDSPEVELAASGLDGIVTVAVNGTVVLRAENSFRDWRVDLSDVAKAGENIITLTFHDVVAEGARRQAAQPFYVPYNVPNNPIGNGNMLRKPACDFGWDWNIALAPCGVTGDLRIEPKRAARLDHLRISQDHSVAGQVTVNVAAQVAGDAEGQVVTFQLGGGKVTGAVSGRVARASMTIKNPELWWPAGQGMQPLYDLDVTLGGQTLSRRLGLRTVELITTPDAAGARFAFKVNGREVFAKGANWIPADALSGRITREATEDLLKSATDAHMNMIRIWGGGRYEPTWFYDLCDELGLMVWQDAMFACHLYPATDDFLAEVDQELRENARRLHHHACLALWCGDNELIGALSWYEESKKDRDRYLVAYDRLNRVVEQAIKAESPDSIWWPSSPSPGYMSFGDAWHQDGSGDMHFWSVWHENRDFAHYHDVKPRFCSEFGFQSYPSMDVIRDFTAPRDWNIAAPVLESHQKNAGGNERIAATMFRYFRFPVDFPNFVYLSQVQQAQAIKTAVTSWRSLRPHCMGTLYWQLNDTWPCASWSSLDYGGGWKLLHYEAQRFYAPVLASIQPSGDGWVINVVSDLPDPIDVVLQIGAVNMAGVTRPLADLSVTVQDRALEVLELGPDLLAEDEIFAFTWQADGQMQGDIFAPRPWKSYDLQDPEISMQIEKGDGVYTITLSAQALAVFVALEADKPGRFDNNAFALFPGHDAVITFTPKSPDAEVAFTLRDLHSATYGETA